MDDKDLVKERIDIVELVGEYVTLKKAGVNYKGLCPFHDEKTPSFLVHPEMGIFKCFGCGESGDVFSWMMKMEGLSFPEALEELAKRAGVQLKKFKPDAQTRSRQQILEILSWAREFYHWLLTEHKIGVQAKDYLNKRGINEKAIKEFNIGWSPSDWDGLVRYLGRRKKVDIKMMFKSGLVVERKSGKGGYDRFRGRVMFPLQNVRGQTVGFSGRVVPGITPGEEKMGKYINTPETEVYHKRELLFGLDVAKQEMKKSNQAILAEGELDVISSWQAGVKNIVAIKGSALSKEQIQTLKRHVEELVLALDTDIAGDQAARKGIQMAQAAGLEVKTVRLGEGKDPDEVIQKDPSLWIKAVKEAKDVYAFYLDSAVERWDVRTPAGKRKIVNDLLPIWAEIPNSIVQSHWIGELGKILGVKEELLLREMRQIGSDRLQRNRYEKRRVDKQEPDSGQGYVAPTKRDRLEQLLFAYWLSKDVREILSSEVKGLIVTVWGKKLLDELEKVIKDEENIEIKTLKNRLPPELQSKVAELLMLPEMSFGQGLKIEKVVYKLKELQIRDELQKVRVKIAKLEEAGESDKLLEAQKKFSDLSSELAKVGGEKV